MSDPTAREEPQQQPAAPGEGRRDRLVRHGRRARLYTWATLLIATLVVLVALILSNTRQVRLSWVFGKTTASLVWIVLVAAIAGWLAGVATSVLFRRRTRAPRA
ncbi:MAG: hypothetical protein ABR569_02010 [Gaiellaceae bacterium]